MSVRRFVLRLFLMCNPTMVTSAFEVHFMPCQSLGRGLYWTRLREHSKGKNSILFPGNSTDPNEVHSQSFHHVTSNDNIQANTKNPETGTHQSSDCLTDMSSVSSHDQTNKFSYKSVFYYSLIVACLGCSYLVNATKLLYCTALMKYTISWFSLLPGYLPSGALSYNQLYSIFRST